MDFPEGNLTLEGPTGILEYYSEALRKHIYLISDFHVREKKCVDPAAKLVHLSDFITMTFDANKDKVIDFFLEKRYTPKKHEIDLSLERNRESYLKDVGDHFKDCFAEQRGDFDLTCRFRNVRFHRADVRSASAISYITEKLRSKITHTMFKRSKDVTEHDIEKIKELGRIALEGLNANTVNQIFQKHKIFKQFDHIENEELRARISQFWLSRANTLYEKMKQTFHLLRNLHGEQFTEISLSTRIESRH